MADEWVVVTGRRRASSSAKQKAWTANAQRLPVSSDTTPKDEDIAKLLNDIKNARASLCESAFYSSLRRVLTQAVPLPQVQHLVTYGLGSFAQPGSAHIRYQAALMIQLSDLMPNLQSLPESYDPVYTSLDKVVLSSLGTRVLAIDQRGERVAHEPTFFYMPHCEIELTLALLACNLASGTLQNVTILGNSLSQYRDRSSMTNRMETLLLSIKVHELPCPEHGFPVTSAFNDMSIHTFSVG
jgi:hypothetical protein